MRISTAERRIAVIGPRASGKTVFLTSLINHLAEHDPGEFRIGAPREPALITHFRDLPPESPDWSRFPWEEYRSLLVHQRSWPKKTRERLEFACEFNRSDWKFQSVRLRLFDLPGERFNDFTMLRDGCDTFETWSDEVVKRLRSDETSRRAMSDYFAALESPASLPATLLHFYKLGLGRLRLEYKSFITPSTFLLDRDSVAVRGKDPQAQALERYVGLSAKEQFCPIPAEARPRFSSLVGAFAGVFERYRQQVVAPVLQKLRSCDGLVVMVDVLGILGDGNGAYNDQRDVLADLMKAIDPKENPFDKALRHFADRFLPGFLTPQWVSRIAFVAPKIDRVPADQRDRVRTLLRSLVASTARDLTGIAVEYLPVSAVASTDFTRQADGSMSLIGSPVYAEDGSRVLAGEDRRIPVSEVPHAWPQEWSAGRFVFPDVYPRIPARRDAVPLQIGLNELFNFLCW